MSERYDVAIIGSGAGGGTLAHALANAGVRVLLLERGDYVPKERQNWDAAAVMQEGRYKTDETWFDGDGRPFRPGMQYFVGGNTKFYGAALLRFREEDFGEVRHYGGVSPGWPISYAELEPYYTAAERLYRVRGKHGVDPTDPPFSADYPFPPVRHEPRIQEIADAFARMGLAPFPLPVGVDRDEEVPESRPCVKCATCDGFPCFVDAKSDAQVCCVDPAVRTGRVRLLTRTRVTRLFTNSAGTEVTAVEAEVNGRRERFHADIVVVSCGAINSAALLLASANDSHPRGLANGSGLVGRNYMAHLKSGLVAISRKRNLTRFQKTLALADFYFGAPDSEYPLGLVQMLGKLTDEMLRADAPRFVPGAVLRFVAERSVDWWLTSEDLPDPDNRVTLRPDGSIQLRYEPNNMEAHRRLVRKTKQILAQSGEFPGPFRFFLSKFMPIGAVAHQGGTCRFGTDPAASVLDVDCRTHELDNLYVVDASFFPSIAAVNPSLTIIANALRVGERIAERLRASRAPAAAAGDRS